MYWDSSQALIWLTERDRLCYRSEHWDAVPRSCLIKSQVWYSMSVGQIICSIFCFFSLRASFSSFSVLVYASGWFWENIRLDKKWILYALRWLNHFWKITLQQSLIIPSALIKYRVTIDKAVILLFIKLVSQNFYQSMHTYNFWRIYFVSLHIFVKNYIFASNLQFKA